VVVNDSIQEESKVVISLDGEVRVFRFERQSLGALSHERVPLEPAPSFVAQWCDNDPHVSVDVEAEVFSENCFVVGVSTSEAPSLSEQRLAQQLRLYTAGMAVVSQAGGAVIEQMAAGSRLPCDGRTGSVVVKNATGDRADLLVVPATVALRNPQSAARRVLQYLNARAQLRLTPFWMRFETRFASLGGADVDGVLEELIQAEGVWIAERLALRTQLQDFLLERNELVIDRATDAEEIDGLRSHIRVLERELARVNAYPTSAPEVDELDVYPDSCVDVIDLARDALTGLLVTAQVEAAARLDEHDRSLDWARRLWTLLRGLNDYARLTGAGAYFGGLADYCRNPPPGVLPLPWAKVALQESEATMNNVICARARVFRVPELVSLDGEAMMVAHLKVDRVPPAPRVHFLDTATRIGQVVVGYVGPHLPTAN
jgi:hypothetical protein